MEKPNVGSARRPKVIPFWIPLVLALAGVGGCTAVVIHGIGNFDMHFGREKLDPIPVPPQACPYLDPVRVVVADLTNLWNEHLFPPREQLVPKLDALDVVLKNAQPHVPTRIAKEFDVVLLETRVGRDELTRDPNAIYMDSLAKGVNALANASDLIGDACGYTLYTGTSF